MGRSKELPWLFFFKAMAAKAMAFFCETTIPKAQHIGIGKLMRPKLQKQSALKLAGRIISQSGGYYTRDFFLAAFGFCLIL